MTKAERKEIQKRLMALERELSGKIKRRQIEPNRKETPEVEDADEQALNEMLQSIASSRNENETVLAARVDSALAKVRETPDELGICEECGDDIVFGRLKVMPYAEYCVECQSKRDPRGLPTRKHLTDFQ